MNWKRCGRKRLWPNKINYPVVFPDGLRKTTKNLSQDRRSPGRDLNLGPPEYEGVLTVRPPLSVYFFEVLWVYYIGMSSSGYRHMLLPLLLMQWLWQRVVSINYIDAISREILVTRLWMSGMYCSINSFNLIVILSLNAMNMGQLRYFEHRITGDVTTVIIKRPVFYNQFLKTCKMLHNSCFCPQSWIFVESASRRIWTH
jgi:hypothetical protein